MSLSYLSDSPLHIYISSHFSIYLCNDLEKERNKQRIAAASGSASHVSSLYYDTFVIQTADTAPQ